MLARPLAKIGFLVMRFRSPVKTRCRLGLFIRVVPPFVASLPKALRKPFIHPEIWAVQSFVNRHICGHLVFACFISSITEFT